FGSFEGGFRPPSCLQEHRGGRSAARNRQKRASRRRSHSGPLETATFVRRWRAQGELLPILEAPQNAPAARRGEELLAHTVWRGRLARTLAGDAHAAEDLVQEACVAGLAREASRPRELRAWLAGVVRRLAARQHRDGAARARREARAARPEEVAPASRF